MITMKCEKPAHICETHHSSNPKNKDNNHVEIKK